MEIKPAVRFLFFSFLFFCVCVCVCVIFIADLHHTSADGRAKWPWVASNFFFRPPSALAIAGTRALCVPVAGTVEIGFFLLAALNGGTWHGPRLVPRIGDAHWSTVTSWPLRRPMGVGRCGPAPFCDSELPRLDGSRDGIAFWILSALSNGTWPRPWTTRTARNDVMRDQWKACLVALYLAVAWPFSRPHHDLVSVFQFLFRGSY